MVFHFHLGINIMNSTVKILSKKITSKYRRQHEITQTLINVACWLEKKNFGKMNGTLRIVMEARKR